MLTLRLDKKLESELEVQSELLGVTKSEVVRMSIREFLQKKEKLTPWELGKDLFGKYSSGDGSLSTKKGNEIGDLIRAKKG